jgi:hypothetical protein
MSRASLRGTVVTGLLGLGLDRVYHSAMTASTESLLRRALMGVLLLGLVGLEVELLLLKHTDGEWQLVPIYAIAIGLVCAVVAMLRPSRVTLGALSVMMQAFIVIGIIGTWQHFDGNVAYAKDSNPSLSGNALYAEAVVGSTPTLAPGAMIQLGLIGLLFTFRHPASQSSRQSNT